MLLYLFDVGLRQTDGNKLLRMNFATEKNEWLGKHYPDFTDNDSWAVVAAKQPRPELRRLARVGSDVGEVLGAEGWKVMPERNGPDTALCNDLPKSVEFL